MGQCCLLSVHCLELALAGTGGHLPTSQFSSEPLTAAQTVHDAYFLYLVNEKSFQFTCLQRRRGELDSDVTFQAISPGYRAFIL